MKEYSTYLFDADGTLFDTASLIIECFKHTLSVNNYPVPSDDEIMSHVGLPFVTQLQYYTGSLSDERVKEIWNYHREYQLSIHQEYLAECPRAKESIDALHKAGKKLGIVTSRTHYTLDLYLKHIGIADYFEIRITPEDVVHAKPDKEPTQKALTLLESKATEALFIGDAIYDQMSAHAAGVDFAYVNWSHIPLKRFEPAPHYTLDTMQDLLIN